MRRMPRPRLHHLRDHTRRLLWLLAAFCFSRGSARVEAWLVNHRRFGPMVRAWRRDRAVPLRAKQIASVMMAASALASWWVLPTPWRWVPGLVCAAVAAWLWSRPSTRPAPRRNG